MAALVRVGLATALALLLLAPAAHAQGKIVFERNDGHIGSVRADGSRERLLARTAEAPSWSGGRVAFQRCCDELRTMRAGGRDERRVDTSNGPADRGQEPFLGRGPEH